MNSIYELIEKISTRTEMYTGEMRLPSVKAFIDGYCFSLRANGELQEFMSDFGGFHDWIAKKYGYESSIPGWVNMLLANEVGLKKENISWDNVVIIATNKQHENATKIFFELVKEYKVSLTKKSK